MKHRIAWADFLCRVGIHVSTFAETLGVWRYTTCARCGYQEPRD